MAKKSSTRARRSVPATRSAPQRNGRGRRPPSRRPPEVGKHEAGPSRRAWLAIAGGLAVVLTGVLVAASVLGAGGSDRAEVTEAGTVAGAEQIVELLDGIPQDGTALGEPDAPVTLVEFADLQCPFCAQWAAGAFPELVDEYVRDGRVRIEFRPLAFIGPDSERGARAALAAGEQNRLWHVLELLYATQGAENSGWVTDELLAAVGNSVPGFDTERMLADADADARATELDAAAGEASAKGIDSTPSFLLGPTGEELERVEVRSLEASELRGRIDALLDR